MTLQELYDALEEAKAERQVNAGRYRSSALPKVFTYYDCTDYVDQVDGDKQARPLLASRNGANANDPEAKLRWYSHLYLLLAYGYFADRSRCAWRLLRGIIVAAIDLPARLSWL